MPAHWPQHQVTQMRYNIWSSNVCRSETSRELLISNTSSVNQKLWPLILPRSVTDDWIKPWKVPQFQNKAKKRSWEPCADNKTNSLLTEYSISGEHLICHFIACFLYRCWCAAIWWCGFVNNSSVIHHQNRWFKWFKTGQPMWSTWESTRTHADTSRGTFLGLIKWV